MPTLPPSGNTAQTRPENRAFYPALDGLRAVAFLMVFGQHYLSLAWGWTGVNVFFVLSGFLITGILFDTRDDPHRARTFYIRRTLRIFPLYYGVFAVLLLLWPVMHWRWSSLWLLWPLYLGNLLRFFGSSSFVLHSTLQRAADAQLASPRLPGSVLYFGHLWSLCVEEQFYLIWPWVVFWIRDRRKLIVLCGATVILGPVFRLVLQATARPWMVERELLYRFTPAQVDALLLGGLVALLWRGPARRFLLPVARIGVLLGTVSLAGSLIFFVHTWQMTGPQYPSWKFSIGLSLVDVYAASVMVCALEPQTLIYRALKQRPLRWMGRLSYGAYVFHDVLHDLYIHAIVHAPVPIPIFARSFAIAGLGLTATMLIAWLSFSFYETPFLNLKNRWTVSPTVPGSVTRG